MGKSVISAIDLAARTINPPVALRAVDYLRVSTEDQTKGYGIAYTGKRTASHIQKKGWAHVATFKDEGESGTLPWQDRDGASEIMELAMQTPRPFDVVVVYETRAIGRKNRVFWEWVWLLKDHGIFVAVVDEDIDNTTEEGEARMQEKAHEAFKELARIRKRTQGGIQEKAEVGGHPGGQARYGYRIKNQGKKGEQLLVIDDCDGGDHCTRTAPCTTMHEAPVLRRAREIAVRMKGNWRKAATYLNAEGFLTRSGKPWTQANLRARLMDEDLLNARYIFRNSKNALLGPDGTPVWGESITLKLDPIFTDEEVAELRRATAKPGRAVASTGRIYTLTGRITSLCGKHYVGSGLADQAPNYVCSGKREAYPGAPTCSCSQLDATAVERWAWEQVCDLLGDVEKLQSLADVWVGQAADQKVDFASRLADLDQKIAEQDDTIDITMVVAAKKAKRQGLSQELAEVAVEKAIKPLLEELEELTKMRLEVELWQKEASKADQRAKDLQALAQMGHDRLEELSRERQQEFFGLLDAKIVITGAPLLRAGGQPCPIAKWFRDHKRPVPQFCDHVWELVMKSEGFPRGGELPRQKGGLAPKRVFEAFLKKARTGIAWPELDAEYGSTGLIGHWKRWRKSGRWDRVMAALEGCEGASVPPLGPSLPPMHMTGEVRPGIILAASDHLPYDQASDPSGQFSRVAYPFTATLAV